MAGRKASSKIIWISLFAIVTVLLCYLFTVVYFFFISPYDISLKLGFWPFGSEASVGQMYMDSVVEIKYKAIDDHFETINVNVIGVNVKKDGLIITALSELVYCSEDAEITINTNGGAAFKGDIVYQDKNRNLAFIKCKNFEGINKAIKIPYVGIGTLSDCKEGTKVIMASVGIKSRALVASVVGGKIEESNLALSVPKEVDGEFGYDYTVSNGFVAQTKNGSNFSGGAVFNKKGKLLGLSFGKLLDTTLDNGNYFIQPVYGAKDYIEAIASSKTGKYQNELVDAFCGFDVNEAEYMVKIWGVDTGKGTFYFDDTWNTITEDVTQFFASGEKGFHLFKEFDYNGNKISQHSAITKVRVGRNETQIVWRSDLIDAVFKAKKGDTVVLTYIEMNSTTPKTLSFTV